MPLDTNWRILLNGTGRVPRLRMISCTQPTRSVELSPDAGQVDLYNADGQNQRIHIINRAAMEVETYFGRRGRNAGQFHWVHNVVVDSNGNFYTAEVNQGRRAQKFVVDGAGELH